MSLKHPTKQIHTPGAAWPGLQPPLVRRDRGTVSVVPESHQLAALEAPQDSAEGAEAGRSQLKEVGTLPI